MRKPSFALSLFVLTATACGVFGTDGESSSSSSGGGGSSSGGGKPPEETSKPPGVDGKPLEGIFVSQTKGNDATGDGSMAKPLATLAAGLAKGQKDRQRVLVCAETYNEQVTWLDGVSAYGYFDCQGPEWKLDEARRAKVQSPKSPALKAEGINLPTRIEGFEIVAPDFGDGSPDEREPMQNSSVAAFVKGSAALTISKSALRAGKGRDGVDGTDPTPLTPVVEVAPVAGDFEAPCTAGPGCLTGPIHNTFGGGAGGRVRCDGGPPGITGPGPGGKGGDGGHWDNGARVVFPGSGDPPADTPATAHGAAPLADSSFGGTTGAAGAKGAPGGAGANGARVLGEDGPVVGDGSAGTPGSGGQGAGGGSGLGWSLAGSSHVKGASGGGGGAGGCPGVNGSPGLGGGDSIGLYAVRSPVALERVTISAAKGGRAGFGTLGSLETDGYPGAASGKWYGDPTRQCFDAGGNLVLCYQGGGGRGGDGGRAGVSGHGAAGASIGVVHFGEAPRVDADSSITPGEGGAGAQQVQRGTGVIPEAPKGASEKIVKAGQ